MYAFCRTVLQEIESHRLIPPGSRVLVAVSGGADSIALLHTLHNLAPNLSCSLSIAHFNHQLRGIESDLDQKLVFGTANSLGIPFHTASPSAHPPSSSTDSLEMYARQQRHRFLIETARATHSSIIALGHHAEDQAELFLLRAIRGAGSEGLAAMDWKTPHFLDPNLLIIRPFLNTPSHTIRQHAASCGLSFREDQSNQNTEIPRNHIRKLVLPALHSLSYASSQKIGVACSILKADHDFIQECASNWRASRASPFLSLHIALQREVMKQELLSLGVKPDFFRIEHLRQKPQSPLTLQPSVQVSHDGEGSIRLLPPQPDGAWTAQALAVDLADPSKPMPFEHLTLSWGFHTLPDSLPRPSHRSVSEELFDADLIGPMIQLRHWRPGDRFQPIGNRSPTKLQDLFTNAKWPRARRHNVVLAATSDNDIFWVEGLRISERFKITPLTRTVLQWTWQKRSEPDA